MSYSSRARSLAISQYTIIRTYLDIVNPYLKTFEKGYEMNIDGEIICIGEFGLEELYKEELLTSNDEVKDRVGNAKLRFRRHDSNEHDRRQAVTELANVSDYLREQTRNFLSRRDENDLMNIANNFSLRHHDPDQKSDYDKDIWYPWMFNFYLSTIHTYLKILDKKKSNN